MVGERHVLVAEAAGGARHHVDLGAAVAPQRVHVEVALQLGNELVADADGEGSLLLELIEVRGGTGGGDLGDDRGSLRADALQLLERAGGDASHELVGREGLHDLGRSQVRADPVRLLARSVEQVRDPFQRLCGLHQGDGTLAARAVTSGYSERELRDAGMMPLQTEQSLALSDSHVRPVVHADGARSSRFEFHPVPADTWAARWSEPPS